LRWLIEPLPFNTVFAVPTVLYRDIVAVRAPVREPSRGSQLLPHIERRL